MNKEIEIAILIVGVPLIIGIIRFIFVMLFNKKEDLEK